MNSYEQKQAARRERLERAADRAEAKAEAAYKRADLREEVSGIPMGQPVLVGHHSERRHRRALERADAAMRQSIEQDKRANDLRGKAASVGTGGVSSDDPDALAKLQAKMNRLELQQTFMRAANKTLRAAIRKGVTETSGDDVLESLVHDLTTATEPGWTIEKTRRLLTPDFVGRRGFADYQLTNNSAEIRRLKQRIARLEKASQAETVERDETFCRVVENVEENRIQIIFDGKPAASIRAVLKSNGFRWAPSAGAWQRQLNNSARYATDRALAEIRKLDV